MNKQDLKASVRQMTARLQNSLLRVVAQFPEGFDWDDRHIRVAERKLVENTELTVEEVIKHIKRCHYLWRPGEEWLLNAGDKHIPLTQEEKDFNERVKLDIGKT